MIISLPIKKKKREMTTLMCRECLLIHHLPRSHFPPNLAKSGAFHQDLSSFTQASRGVSPSSKAFPQMRHCVTKTMPRNYALLVSPALFAKEETESLLLSPFHNCSKATSANDKSLVLGVTSWDVRRKKLARNESGAYRVLFWVC